MKLGIGQPVARVEDHRLLRGRGRFTDDINLPDQLHGCVVRSPHPHARIAGIDIVQALAAPGVAAIFTGVDVEADGLGTLPSLARGAAALTRPDGSPIYEPGRLALQSRKVSFVGDCVAFVVADTAARARDAADLVEVEYEPLPVVTSAEEALTEGAPAVWQDCPDNVCYRIRLGDAEAVAVAFARAAHVTRVRLPISRVCMNPMEPRSALGSYDAWDGRYTLHTGSQNPHAMREWIARDVLGIPESQLRVVSPDMGGSFGLRASVFPEMALVLWASRKLGRPVKWTGDRSEAHLADDHARDQVMEIELALDGDGRFVALRVGVVAAMGAYLSYFGPFPPFVNLGGLAGVYRTPAICADVHAVFTNTAPTAPYRGAGRPEAALAIEHVIDRAAREFGVDRVELRRRNLIPPEAMPFRTGLSFRYDCGEFERNMDEALAAIDIEGFASRREEAEAAGRLRGLGIANTIEQSAGVTDEWANIALDPGGSATISVGAHSHGQGHETVFRQLVAERLGLDFERIRYVQGDTDQVPYGWGTGGSRVAVLGGSALVRAMDRIVERGPATCGALSGMRRRRRRVRARPIPNLRYRSLDRPPGSAAHRVQSRSAAAGRGGRVVRFGIVRPFGPDLSDRLPRLRSRNRPGDRSGRDAALLRGRGRRHGAQPHAAAGPVAGRHRAGIRSDRARTFRARRDRAAAHRFVHGLCDAARRRGAVRRDRTASGADRTESARREGRGGSGHRREHAVRDERDSRRTRVRRCRRIRDAGHPGADLARDSQRAELR